MPCPVCRHEFLIPKNGVADLTVRTHDIEHVLSSVCEACSTDENSVSATVFCVDCCQKLCRRCSIPHKKMRGGPHDVRPLETMPSECRAGGRFCDQHQERLRMYCFDCDVNVCSTCCFEAHARHKFERIEVVAEEFARSIDDDIEPVTSRVDSFHGAVAQVEAENSKLLGSMRVIELEIRYKGKEVKQSIVSVINCQVSDLLDKLQSVKSAAEKEAKSQTDEMQLALTELESFKTSSLELTSKGSPSDITQAASGVRVRAKELLHKHIIRSEYHLPSYTFTPMNIDELLRDDQNYVGCIEDSGNYRFYPRLLISNVCLFCCVSLSKRSPTLRRPTLCTIFIIII